MVDSVHEANRLRAELTVARMAERAAREKYQDFMRTSSMYGVSAMWPSLYQGPADRKFSFGSNHESNRRLRFEFELNLESNQGVVVYVFNADLMK